MVKKVKLKVKQKWLESESEQIMQRPRMKSVAWLYRNGSGVF